MFVYTAVHYPSHKFTVDGPEMILGAERYVILQNDSVSLTCGYDLDSNPRADITWRYPNGSKVSSSDDRIEMVYEQGVVQLRISDVNLSDNGSWACIVEVNRTCVNDEVLGGSRGSVCDDIAAISRIEREIELVVVGKCTNLSSLDPRLLFFWTKRSLWSRLYHTMILRPAKLMHCSCVQSLRANRTT